MTLNNEEYITMTEDIIEKARSSRGAWNKKQFEVLGLNHEQSDWKSIVIGRRYPVNVIIDFVAMRNEHLANELTRKKNKQRWKDKEFIGDSLKVLIDKLKVMPKDMIDYIKDSEETGGEYGVFYSKICYAYDEFDKNPRFRLYDLIEILDGAHIQLDKLKNKYYSHIKGGVQH